MKSRWWFVLPLLFLIALGSPADNRNSYPLPEERGTAGILSALEQLPVYVRVLHTTAHPDDESAGTLTWLTRKYHADTALFCLTRGEGGQNILGNEKYEALGLLRTGELLEACRYYGAHLFFSKSLDFGFSKTAEETLEKWGHQAVLEDMVRFIRRWKPAIVISKFQGTSSDGHGHHQASGILTKEAFRAAADPQQFPDQVASGLQPWQAKKLYVSLVGGEFPPQAGSDKNASEWTVRVPVGDYDPVLGRSYREIGSEGYSKHRSQGNGAVTSLPGRGYEYFKLVDSLVGTRAKEDSFFDSIDTALVSIWELAGDEKSKVLFLQKDLEDATQAALNALQDFRAMKPERSAAAVIAGTSILAQSIRKVEEASISASPKDLLLDALRSKQIDFQKAASAVLGIYLVARTDNETGIPGAKETVTLYFYNRGKEAVTLDRINFSAPGIVSPAAANPPFGNQEAGSSAIYKYSVAISPEAKLTEPFWYLENSRDARYQTGPTGDDFAPFGDPEIKAEAVYRYAGTDIPISSVARAQAGGPLRGSDFVEFQLVPAVSVVLEPGFKVAPISSLEKSYRFQVSVLSNRNGVRGLLKLKSANGWQIRPNEVPFMLSRKGETFTQDFTVQVPAGTKTGNYPVEAIATVDGKEFRQGCQTISYPENWTRNLYCLARSKLEVFDVKTSANLTVGYVPGAGDEIPAALEQLGINVHSLSGTDLAFGDLSRFSAIVLGIRAYNVNELLKAHNQRILDYVAQGGTLIVQYMRPLDRPAPGSTGSPFPYGPYPMSVSDADRITVEDSPLRILDSANSIFDRPNKITTADFQGWVQERGLYFMNAWDSRYEALISGNDPGEKPQNGGMLLAKYGKGYYLYTGYAWFRQLPAGVPGAFRIFANMISLGQK
jgi:LmbE family N-acetylglucosaminyl deacetylase